MRWPLIHRVVWIGYVCLLFSTVPALLLCTEPEFHFHRWRHGMRAISGKDAGEQDPTSEFLRHAEVSNQNSSEALQLRAKHCCFSNKNNCRQNIYLGVNYWLNRALPQSVTSSWFPSKTVK